MNKTYLPSLKILTASAGSGKTFALAVHYLTLLIKNPYNYREILALTFTNKATAEMKDRILSVLESLAGKSRSAMNNSHYMEVILKEFPAFSRQDIHHRADLAYRMILHDYSRFSVTTIDGFSQQVIRGFTYELGLDNAFALEMNMDKVRRDLMTQLYKQLNDDQGLFQWVINQILDLVHEGKSWNINRQLYDLSGMIFSDDFKAFEDRINKHDSGEVFESIAAFNKEWMRHFTQTVEQFTSFVDAERARYNVTETDLYRKTQNGLLKLGSCVDKKDFSKLHEYVSRFADQIDHYQSEKNRSENVQQWYDRINADMVLMEDFLTAQLPQYYLVRAVEANIHHLRLLKTMAGALAEWRSTHNAQLISDGQTLLQKIGLNAHGDPTFIWEKIGSRYKYFLFDEFQDTSQTQWDNLYPLLANALSVGGSGTHEHLIVGDVKQSIYRWRNGDFRILLHGIENNIKSTFHVPDTTDFVRKDSLNFNYRSDAQIIAFNNFLFSRIPSMLQEQINNKVFKNEEDAAVTEHWLSNELDQALLLAYSDAEQKVPSHRLPDKGEVLVRFLEGEDEKSLLADEFREKACETCYEQIVEWLISGKYKAGEIGLLVRTNKEARLLVEFLIEKQQDAKMQFQVLSGDALVLGNHPVIRSLIHFLRYLSNESPAYNHDLAMALYFYKQDIGEVLSSEDWLAVGQADILSMREQLPAQLLKAWPTLKLLPLGELVEQLIDCCGWRDNGSAVPYLLAFRDWVGKAVRSGSGGLQRLLAVWEEENDRLTLPSETGTNAVEVLTIHKAKGLDFEAVIIPFCHWGFEGHLQSLVWADLEGTIFEQLGRIPLPYRNLSKTSVKSQYYEELLYHYMDALNNFYVATTRARSSLCVYAPAKAARDAHGAKELEFRDLGHLLMDLMENSDYAKMSEGTNGYIIAEKPDDPMLVPDSENGLFVASDDLCLSHYTVSATMASTASKHLFKDAKIDSKQHAVARLSTILHDIMANAKNRQEAQQQLNGLKLGGSLDVSDHATLSGLLDQAWSHPTLGQLLEMPEQANELALVDLEGKTWRPDKVFFFPDTTMVVDFKMTSEMIVHLHSAQIERYKALLRAMKYPDVSGYLYYFKQNQWVAVEA